MGLKDSSSQTVVAYVYDAWGRLLSTEGDMQFTLGLDNPLRYRGYVYDRETGLYYLQSRYYNPTIGRFINIDSQLCTDSFTGLNLFVYCNNNPVRYLDQTGKEPIFASIAITLLTAVGIVVGVSVVAYYAANILVEVGTWITDTITTLLTSAEKSEPDPPDVTYPGDNPTEAPDGYEWRGPDKQGGKRGGYANPNGKDSWHPDLDHPDGVDPHWDYNDGYGHRWRVFPDRIELAPN